MSTLKLVTVFLTCLLLISCSRTARLKKTDFKWIPYAGNETLVFESNTGDNDTIFLLGSDRGTAPDDPLAVFPKKFEHFTILSKRSDPSPPDGSHRYLESPFLELSAAKNGLTNLAIDLTGKDAWFYGGRFLSIKDLESIKPISLSTKLKAYKDIILLKPESNEYLQRSDFITTVYWSKSDGLIRYDKKDSVYWQLTKKYSR